MKISEGIEHFYNLLAVECEKNTLRTMNLS